MHSRARIKLVVKVAVLLILTNGIEAQITTTGANVVESTIEPPKQAVANSTISPTTVTETPTEVPVTTELTQQSTKTITTAKETNPTVTSSTTTTAKPNLQPDIGDAGHDKAPNCSQFPLSPIQPVYDKNSLIKKCCPFGQIFEQAGDGRFRCVQGERLLDVETIYAVFYGDSECIEDKQNKLHFSYEPNDSCLGNNQTFQYSKAQGDELFVIQNGSLLVLEEGGFMSVFDYYCVEVDTNSRLLAKACDAFEPIVLKSTAVLIYIGMVVAAITLLFTCLAYALVPKLNDVFGYLLAAHSGTFLLGLILMCLAVCGDRCVDHGSAAMVQVFAHIFLMSSIYAFLLMNIYNYVYAAYYLPNGLEFDTRSKRDVYIFLGVLYTITILPLFLPWKNALIFHLILYIYYIAIAVVIYLCYRALLTLADSRFIRFTVSQQNYNELTYTEAVNASLESTGKG